MGNNTRDPVPGYAISSGKMLAAFAHARASALNSSRSLSGGQASTDARTHTRPQMTQGVYLHRIEKQTYARERYEATTTKQRRSKWAIFCLKRSRSRPKRNTIIARITCKGGSRTFATHDAINDSAQDRKRKLPAPRYGCNRTKRQQPKLTGRRSQRRSRSSASVWTHRWVTNVVQL